LEVGNPKSTTISLKRPYKKKMHQEMQNSLK